MSVPGAAADGHLVDATGLHCPVPVRRLAAAIDVVAIGTVVELRATDPTARIDVPVWCRLQGHRLREVTELTDGWRFRVQRTR